MIKTRLLTLACSLSLSIALAQGTRDNGSETAILAGPYLGQKQPGLTPEVFAPGIVTTEEWGDAGTFSPDMNEFYVSRWRVVNEKVERKSVTFKRIGNQWHEQDDPLRRGIPSISPDEMIMHFGNKYRERTETGWSEVKSLGAPFDTIRIMGLTASANGTFVFDEIGTNGDGLLRYSRLIDGIREAPQPFGKEINTGTWNAHPYIAPDESYIMWDGERESGYGSNDLYISFRQTDGSWGEAINMGEELNTEAEEGGPRITPDGKYLFFNRVVKPATRDGEPTSDLFWVDAQIIERFRVSPISSLTLLSSEIPQDTALIFAPDVISTEQSHESSIAFNQDMTELYFGRREPNEKYKIFTMRLINGKWSEAALAPFSRNKEFSDYRPRLTPEGDMLYFSSTRPLTGATESSGSHQWYVKKNESGWGLPTPVEKPFTGRAIVDMTASENGNLYFSSNEKDAKPESEGIYYSVNQGGQYSTIERMTEKINSHDEWTCCPYIAPDESYMIYDSPREGGFGWTDLYMSFNRNGSWTRSYNLGPKVNTKYGEGMATVSPDGRYLIFYRDIERKGDIYWTDFIQLKNEILENINNEYSAHSYAQDGEDSQSTPYTIVYGSITTRSLEIYTGNTEEEPTINRIKDAPAGYLAWSPDGNQFAYYYKYDDRKTWSIHTMNVDGTDRKRLTHAKNKWDSAPSWSPDGKKIAFARTYKNAEEQWYNEIWMMNADGSEQTQVKSLKGSGPYFTPDGRIVFYSDYVNGKSEICIANADGTNLVNLTSNEVHDWHPDVSPDGTQIAYMSKVDGDFEIYVMNIDGSGQKRLTYNDQDNWYPSWSPDGLKIIFSSVKDYDKEEKDIYVMNKDGSSVRKIISGSGYAVFKR